jgi:Na+-driven multidrug efflux pump
VAGTGLVPRIFTGDDAVLDSARALWPLFAIALPFAGAVFALDGILIGASDGPYLAVSMLTAFAACATLLGVVLAADWGIRGVWSALLALILIRLAAMLTRFARRRWLVTGWA